MAAALLRWVQGTVGENCDDVVARSRAHRLEIPMHNLLLVDELHAAADAHDHLEQRAWWEDEPTASQVLPIAASSPSSSSSSSRANINRRRRRRSRVAISTHSHHAITPTVGSCFSQGVIGFVVVVVVVFVFVVVGGGGVVGGGDGRAKAR